MHQRNILVVNIDYFGHIKHLQNMTLTIHFPLPALCLDSCNKIILHFKLIFD